LSFQYFHYLHEFPGTEKWYYDFREMSNFTLSVITIFGEFFGKTVQAVKNKKDKKTD